MFTTKPLPKGDTTPVETLEDIDVEILLVSVLSLCERSDPTVEINLALLTSVERRVLLTLLFEHLGFVRDVTRRWLGGAGSEFGDREVFHAA